MGRTLPRGLLEGDLHSPDVCMLLIIFFIFCRVRWSVSRDCNESITVKKLWFQLTGCAISSMFGKYKWETSDISILQSYERTLKSLRRVSVCVCLNWFKTDTGVSWQVCFTSAAFSHARWWRWTSESPRSFCRHVQPLTGITAPVWQLLSFFWLERPNISQWGQALMFFFSCGEN